MASLQGYPDVDGIHPLAVVSPEAKIGKGSSVGPFSIIGPKVELGENVKVASHVVIDGFTSIGDNTTIFQFASIGAPPQDLKYHGEESSLKIGVYNIIREYVTIQPGTKGGGLITKVGNNNLFMACSHVAHDVTVGNHVILANSAAIAGHARIDDKVIIGGLSGIHQFAHIGTLAMIGAGAMVSRDVPPYAMVQGDRARFVGVNVVGLERAQIDKGIIRKIRTFYSRFYSSSIPYVERISVLSQDIVGSGEGDLLMSFLKNSRRGIVAMRRKSSLDNDVD